MRSQFPQQSRFNPDPADRSPGADGYFLQGDYLKPSSRRLFQQSRGGNAESASIHRVNIFGVSQVPTSVDYVVVGAGIAGLRAAVELAGAGRVLVLAKKELAESATQYAQGGIAVALSDDDEVGLHLQDTIDAGDGLVNQQAARILVEEGPARIQELIDWGTEFDRVGSRLTFTREGAHSRSRVLHAHGDSTGQEIGRALAARARTLNSLAFREFEFTAGLELAGGCVTGVSLMGPQGNVHKVHCQSVLLATGGAGQVYSNTTNPRVATGDGIAMAYRAGAIISDMEFVQFHPTALYIKGAPRFLLSEALRGEGAYLRNAETIRFMPKYHPQAELAPRDVVARAIVHELELSKARDPVVFLDLTHLNVAALPGRFPRIYATCMQYGIDLTVDQIPIRPAAHYAMGGVKTDLHGQTSVAGLFAAGEAACTGVHGANRLASNSLLEGLVFGARAASRMKQTVAQNADSRGPARAERKEREDAREKPKRSSHDPDLLPIIQQLMWNLVGVVRTRESLAEAVSRLQEMLPQLPAAHSRSACEIRNVHQNATLIAISALAREESRGAHYRTDFPAHNDAKFKKHSAVSGGQVRFE